MSQMKHALMLLTVLTAGGAADAAPPLERHARTGNPTLEVSHVSFKGASALRAIDRKDVEQLDPLVLLAVDDFTDGVIEAEVAGLPAAHAGEGARGFVGIAFRVQPDGKRYEAFYIRPTNGRADDQLRRNHSTQYISMPENPWHRLRQEQPGMYESYADVVPGEWIGLRIEVRGAKAQFYVAGADQPSLIVNDLKLGADVRGGIALWVGDGTEAYFRNVRVTKAAGSLPVR